MLYKFDILFKKELRGGGVKVVTYRQLLQDADTFVALVPKTGPCTVADAESELTLQPGELVLVPAACKGVTLQGHCLVKSIKCISEK